MDARRVARTCHQRHGHRASGNPRASRKVRDESALATITRAQLQIDTCLAGAQNTHTHTHTPRQIIVPNNKHYVRSCCVHVRSPDAENYDPSLEIVQILISNLCFGCRFMCSKVRARPDKRVPLELKEFRPNVCKD